LKPGGGTLGNSVHSLEKGAAWIEATARCRPCWPSERGGETSRKEGERKREKNKNSLDRKEGMITANASEAETAMNFCFPMRGVRAAAQAEKCSDSYEESVQTKKKANA